MKIAQHEFDEIWLERWLINITLTTLIGLPRKYQSLGQKYRPRKLGRHFRPRAWYFLGKTAKVVSIIILLPVQAGRDLVLTPDWIR